MRGRLGHWVLKYARAPHHLPEALWRYAFYQPSFLNFVAMVGGSRFAAFLLSRAVRPPANTQGGLNVLCITRPFFDRDLTEMEKRTDINFIRLPKNMVQNLQQPWVPWEMRRQVFYAGLQGAKYRRAAARMEQFAGRTLTLIARRFPIHAVMSANIDYWQDIGFIAACRDQQIPFVVLSREYGITPTSLNWFVYLYKFTGFKFTGDNVAVFNEETRHALIEGGACKPGQVAVTGAPRTDTWRDVPRQTDLPDSVVLLSYGEPEYLAPENYREMVRLFADGSRRNTGSDVRFVLKCKNTYNMELARGILSEFPSHRVTLTENAALFDLLPRSRLIMGFNSFALVEALYTDVPVAIPYWGDARRPEDELIAAPTSEASRNVFSYVDSADEMTALIDAAARNEGVPAIDREQRNAYLSAHIHYDEERTSSEMVANWLRQRIDVVNTEKRAGCKR